MTTNLAQLRAPGLVSEQPADLTREVRFHGVVSYGKGATGPVEHVPARYVGRAAVGLIHGTREGFRRALLAAGHVRLAAGETKDVHGGWIPADFRDRAGGGVFTTTAGRAYDHEHQVARQKVNVFGSSACCWLDVDKLPTERWRQVVDKIRTCGFSGEAWSTASYDPASGKVSARLRLNLDRELTSGGEIRAVRIAVSRLLGNVADPKCLQPASVFYPPTTKHGASFIETFDGGDIVVDALELGDTTEGTTLSASAWKASGDHPAPMPHDFDIAAEELADTCEFIEQWRGYGLSGELYPRLHYLAGRVCAGHLDAEDARDTLDLAMESGLRAEAEETGRSFDADAYQRRLALLKEHFTEGKAIIKAEWFANRFTLGARR